MQLAYEVKAYLLENYTQPGIDDIIKIAATFNTTKKTLTRHFKNNLGVTVHQLIQKLRLEKAMQLLSIHKLPVKEVCEQVGYIDVYNFSRKFKGHFKRTAKDVLKHGL